MKIGMVIDLDKCIGCRSCAVACKQHNAQPPGNWWNRVFTPGSARHLSPPADAPASYLPVHCQHCVNSPCEKVCPVGATYRQDSAVLIDFERCIGCRYCMAACPYGVRQFNWEAPASSHARQQTRPAGVRFGYPADHRKDGRLVYARQRPRGVVEKCTFCVQYRDRGMEPACVSACPGKARITGDLDDADSEVSRLIRDAGGFQLLAEKGTEPTVYYLPPRRKRKEGRP